MLSLFKTMFVATSTLFVGDYFIKDNTKHTTKVNRHYRKQFVDETHTDNKNCPLDLTIGGKKCCLKDGRLFCDNVEYVVITREKYNRLNKENMENEI